MPQPPGLPGQQRGEPGSHLSPESAVEGIITVSRSSLKTHGLQWPAARVDRCPGNSACCCVIGVTDARQAKAGSGAPLTSPLVGPWSAHLSWVWGVSEVCPRPRPSHAGTSRAQG